MIFTKHRIILFGTLCILIFTISCNSIFHTPTNLKNNHKNERINWFPKIDTEKLASQKGTYFIKGLSGYQQTTEYTCGPAALLAFAKYYNVPGVELTGQCELKIAKEAGTRFPDSLKEGEKIGTKPEEMAKWLTEHGFDVKVEYENKADASALKKLEENIINNIPTIIEWADLTGHYGIAVGFDNRGNDDPWDDVLIFADSYDKYDDYNDGYSFVNANRFYWLWYDAFYFDNITWRTMITAIPKKK